MRCNCWAWSRDKLKIEGRGDFRMLSEPSQGADRRFAAFCRVPSAHLSPGYHGKSPLELTFHQRNEARGRAQGPHWITSSDVAICRPDRGWLLLPDPQGGRCLPQARRRLSWHCQPRGEGFLSTVKAEAVSYTHVYTCPDSDLAAFLRAVFSRKEFAKACRVAHPSVARERLAAHFPQSLSSILAEPQLCHNWKNIVGRHTASTPSRTSRTCAFAKTSAAPVSAC